MTDQNLTTISDEIQERWLPIPGFPGYDVSDQGRIRSYRKRTYHTGVKGCDWVLDSKPQRILKPKFTVGYLTVSLSIGGRRYTFNIHRLLLLAFVGQCPPGMEACHDDGIRHHCTLDNLRWDTTSNNHLDKRKHGTDPRGERSGNEREGS